MQFTIPCETYVRLTEATKPLPNTQPPAYLNCIAIERRNGRDIAIASNNKFCAVQNLTNSDQPDAMIFLPINAAIIAQCVIEAQFDSDLIIDTMDAPGVVWGTLRTTFGWAFQGNALAPECDHEDWHKWRSWVPDTLPKKAKGFIYISAEMMLAMCHVAPSKRLVWPEIIDTDVAIMCRDAIDPDFAIIFMGIGRDTKGFAYTAATLPDWL